MTVDPSCQFAKLYEVGWGNGNGCPECFRKCPVSNATEFLKVSQDGTNASIGVFGGYVIMILPWNLWTNVTTSHSIFKAWGPPYSATFIHSTRL